MLKHVTSVVRQRQLKWGRRERLVKMSERNLLLVGKNVKNATKNKLHQRVLPTL